MVSGNGAGKQLPFDRAIINHFYNLPDIDNDEYTYIIEDHDLNQVIVVFCITNHACEINNNEELIKMSFKSFDQMHASVFIS